MDRTVPGANTAIKSVNFRKLRTIMRHSCIPPRTWGQAEHDLEFEEFIKSVPFIESIELTPEHAHYGYLLTLRHANKRKARMAVIPWLKAHPKPFRPIWHYLPDEEPDVHTLLWGEINDYRSEQNWQSRRRQHAEEMAQSFGPFDVLCEPDFEFEEFLKGIPCIERIEFLPKAKPFRYCLTFKYEHYQTTVNLIDSWLAAHQRDFEPILEVPWEEAPALKQKLLERSFADLLESLKVAEAQKNLVDEGSPVTL